MSFVYPQFGNPDYSGFTTEEELARRYITTGARGSPTIGAQMYIPTPNSQLGMPIYKQTPDIIEPSPDISARHASIARDVRDDRDVRDAIPTRSVSDAVVEIFHSRPVSAFDWVIIFILIIAAVCFFQHANDVINSLFRIRRPGGVTGGSVISGNFCTTCGGTV